MTDPLILMIAAAVSQTAEVVKLPVHGRDYSSLDNSVVVFRGFCDGREASATLVRAFSGRAGQLILRYGRLSREVPASFLNGRLLGSTFYAAGLGCDGRRLVFRARAARMDDSGRTTVQVQSVTLDSRTGQLSVSEIRNLTEEETRRELR